MHSRDYSKLLTEAAVNAYEMKNLCLMYDEYKMCLYLLNI